jgi:hypothetical protein
MNSGRDTRYLFGDSSADAHLISESSAENQIVIDCQYPNQTVTGNHNLKLLPSREKGDRREAGGFA